jgi:predicted nucleotidyltransferase
MAASDSGGLNADFLDVLRTLNDAGAEFLLVGAHAMAVHGFPRATGDLDLLVRPTEENAERVLAGLRAFGAPVDAHGVTASDLATPGTVYQIGVPPRRIDILTRISGVSFDEASRDRLVVEMDGLAIPVVGRAALIRNKRAAGRDKDVADLKLLETPGTES